MDTVEEIEARIEAVTQTIKELEADVASATVEAQDASDKADALAVKVELGEADAGAAGKARSSAEKKVLKARQLAGVLDARHKALAILPQQIARCPGSRTAAAAGRRVPP